MRQHSPHHPKTDATPPNPASPVTRPPVKPPAGDGRPLLSGRLNAGDQSQGKIRCWKKNMVVKSFRAKRLSCQRD